MHRCLPKLSIPANMSWFLSGPHDRRLTPCMLNAIRSFLQRSSQRAFRCAAYSFALVTNILAGAAFTLCAFSSPFAIAQGLSVIDEPDARAEQARLSDHIRQHPTDYEATYRYVLLSTELKDYEAGIGALERLLGFNPSLSRARKELGFLYARLGAYQVAAQHLRKALAAGDLDPVQVAQIEAHLSDIEKQNEAS